MSYRTSIPASLGLLVMGCSRGSEGGLAVASDGSVYVSDDVAKRIVHFSSSGQRLGFVGPVLDVPYGLAADRAGGVFVTEANATGHIEHVAPDGTVTTLSTH